MSVRRACVAGALLLSAAVAWAVPEPADASIDDPVAVSAAVPADAPSDVVAAEDGSATDAGPWPADIDREALRGYERLGLALFRADRTAWLTTDQLAEHGIVRRGRPVGVPGKPAGWISAPTADPGIWHVAYISETSGGAVAYAEGTVDFTAQPLASLRRNEPPRALTGEESLQRAIVSDALKRPALVCSRSAYNAATVPDGRGGWHVYLSPPQSDARVYPMGGFHRFDYDADGGFVAHHPHTRGCLDQSEKDLPRGATLEALMTSHITGPTPNEFHVFMSLAYGKDVYVATMDGKLWSIQEGRIRFVSLIDSD